eukprot:9118598-Alexandrium_andersonii.AAC.1
MAFSSAHFVQVRRLVASLFQHLAGFGGSSAAECGLLPRIAVGSGLRLADCQLRTTSSQGEDRRPAGAGAAGSRGVPGVHLWSRRCSASAC